MNKTTLGGVALLIGAATLAYWFPRTEPQPDPVARYNATEAMYAAGDDLRRRMSSIDDEDLEAHFFALNFDYAVARSLQRDRDFPDPTVTYAVHDLAALPYYPDMTAFAEGYLDALFAEWHKGIDYPYINIRKPFLYTFGEEVTVTSITTTDGIVVRVLPEEDPQATGLQVFEGAYSGEYAFKSPFGITPEMPARATIAISVDVPGDLTVLSFPDAKVGDQKSHDDYVLTVTDMASHYAEVTVSRRDGRDLDGSPIRLDIAAFDTNGHPIQRGALATGSTTDVASLRDGIEEVIALADTDIAGAREKAEMLVRDNQQHVTRASFRGRITSLEIYVFGTRNQRTITRDLTIPVMPYVGSSNEQVQALSPEKDIIDPELLILTDGTPDIFAARELRQNLTSWQNGQSLYFALPPRVSDLFLGDSDRMNPSGNLNFGRANRDIDHDDWFLYSVQPMRIDFDPDAFPEKPRSISGKVAFHIIDGISRETHSVDALPQGIAVDRNRITLSGDIYSAFNGRAGAGGNGRADGDTIDSTLKVIALNAAGQPLQQFHAISNQDSRDPQVSLYVYGVPAEVMVLRRGPLSEVTYRVDRELNPLLYNLPRQ